MRLFITQLLAISRAVVALALVGGVASAQTPLPNLFTNPGTANWNGSSPNGNSANWSEGFQPTADFSVGVNEFGVINNGGTAFLDAPALFPVGGVFLGENVIGADPVTDPALDGTLEIRSGGVLDVIVLDPLVPIGDIDGGGAGLGAGDRMGSVRVGGATNTGGTPDSATGTLIVQQGGTLNSFVLDTFGTTGPTDVRSSVQLSGVINTDSAVLRADTVLNPSGQLNVANRLFLTGGSALTYNLSGATNSVIQVGQTALIDGTAEVNFDTTPTVGQSFTLISAAGGATGQFSGVSHNLDLAAGQVLDAENVPNGLGTDVTVSVQETLVLNVNRGDGTISIENPHGSSFGFRGYSINSPDGSLSPDNWTSMADGSIGGFVETPSTANLLSEIDSTPAVPATISGGGSQSLGQALDAGFGTPGSVGDDLEFTVLRDDGRQLQGIVNLTGPEFNNLVLRVSTETGDATITNPSETNVAINGYTIASASGALLTDFDGLEDDAVAGWAEANISENRLSEINGLTLTESINPGETISLSGVWDIAGAEDLTFQFNDPSLGAFTGVVQYVTGGLLGDYKGDNVVNAADYTVWRNNLGVGSLPNEDPMASPGVVDAADYQVWRTNYGMSAGAGAGAGSSAQVVPEPTAALLVLAGVSLALPMGRRR